MPLPTFLTFQTCPARKSDASSIVMPANPMPVAVPVRNVGDWSPIRLARTQALEGHRQGATTFWSVGKCRLRTGSAWYWCLWPHVAQAGPLIIISSRARAAFKLQIGRSRCGLAHAFVHSTPSARVRGTCTWYVHVYVLATVVQYMKDTGRSADWQAGIRCPAPHGMYTRATFQQSLVTSSHRRPPWLWWCDAQAHAVPILDSIK
jgi:hypothetical protein